VVVEEQQPIAIFDFVFYVDVLEDGQFFPRPCFRFEDLVG